MTPSHRLNWQKKIELDGTLYKGFTMDYVQRLEEHNAGNSQYTSTKIPWKLVFVQGFETKREALIREKSLKRANTDYLRWLITQPMNILNQGD